MTTTAVVLLSTMNNSRLCLPALVLQLFVALAAVAWQYHVRSGRRMALHYLDESVVQSKLVWA
jgi:hypothetical protein